MPTVNEELHAREVGHQIDLLRYSNGVVRRIISLLNRADVDLFAQLTAALERLSSESFTVERLDGLLHSVRALNAGAYQALQHEIEGEMRSLVEFEATYQAAAFRAVLPEVVIARVGIVPVSAEQTYTAAMARPFQGRLLKEWAATNERNRMTRIRDAVRMGYLENETTSQIVRRVRGTRVRGYSDGVIEIDRRDAEAVVRTALSHAAGITRDRFFGGNSDLIKAEAWSSTLDTRTSEICRARDGKQYTPDTHKPIGHKLPWLGGPGRAHWCCRSCSTPVTKSWRELGIPIDDMPPGDRASMDGQVPADVTYNQWLAKQSAARQDEVLGPTRGKLFRQGGLPIEKFTNEKGVMLTLEQLRERDAQAFKRAGV